MAKREYTVIKDVNELIKNLNMVEKKYNKSLDMETEYWKYAPSDEKLLELVDIIFRRISNRKPIDLLGCFAGRMSQTALKKIKDVFKNVDEITNMNVWIEVYNIYSNYKKTKEN